jgi:6-phosphofructokinase 1
MDRFLAAVKSVHGRLGRCLVAVSEGIADESGEPIAAKFSREVDAHGNVQLSGTGALGDLLAAEIKARLGISRVRADTFGYIQRSFPGTISAVDAREARQVGALAVRAACAGAGAGSIAILRKPGPRYAARYACIPLENVERESRSMPDRFISRDGNDVTPAFIRYAAPLVGELPRTARLRCVKVRKGQGRAS